MKKLLLCILSLAAVPLAQAQVPNLLNYQGRVAVGSVNFDGTGQFKFALVNATGTTTFWSNDGTSAAGSQPTTAVSLTVTKGLYSVQLGDTALANMTAVPTSVFNNSDVRLRVWFNDGVNGFQLLTPDQRITAVGYAMMAGGLSLPATTGISEGVITQDGISLIHTYGPGGDNFFAGAGAGNFTMNTFFSFSGNTGVGSLALSSNTTGMLNTASGRSALHGNTTGTENTATGASALVGNTTGSFNTASGNNALSGNTTGSRNIALGYRAGRLLTTGSNNIDIGNEGVAGEFGIIRIGTGGTHTDTYLTGVIHGDGSGLTGISAANITGTITGSQIANGAVSATQLASNLTLGGTTTGTFSGNLTGNAATATSATTSTNFTGTLSGDVTGTQPATTVGKLRGIAVSSTPPLNHQILRYTGTAWTPSATVLAEAPLGVNDSGAVPLITLDVVPISKGGTGSNVQSFVDLVTDQVIGGEKEFSGFGVFANGLEINSVDDTAVNAESATGVAVYAHSSGGGTAVNAESTSGDAIYAHSMGGQGVNGQSMTGDGILGTSDSSSGVHGESMSGPGVFGESTTNSGVHGKSDSGVGSVGISATSTGVHGESDSGVGVFGQSNSGIGSMGISTSNTGVQGESDTGLGIYGRSNSKTGVHGESTSWTGVHGESDSGLGVYGRSNSNTGVSGESTTGRGVLGRSSSNIGVRGESAGSFGVYGYSQNNVGILAASGTGYAGAFDGRVSISGDCSVGGTLSKGGGSFKIDHPQDPANKYLSHSFVESPDMMNIYNGNVETDANGLAVVALPTYFTALNRDYRYQLTVIGQFAQAIVAEEVKDNRFTIKTSVGCVKVSWQVTGIRQDAFANAHRIPEEEDKKGEEVGNYLHPELFGQSVEKSINCLKMPLSTSGEATGSTRTPR